MIDVGQLPLCKKCSGLICGDHFLVKYTGIIPKICSCNLPKVHPTAIIYPDVLIESDVTIGAYCVIGSQPEHREFYDGTKPTKGVHIKKGARIFEFVSIQAGTKQTTTIGEGAQIFNHSHIAHDCIVGDHSIIGGSVTLAGHTVVMEGANVSGQSCTHQHSVIGAYAFIGGQSFVTKNIEPGVKACGSPARTTDINEVGLSRAGLTYDECLAKFRNVFASLCGERK